MVLKVLGAPLGPPGLLVGVVVVVVVCSVICPPVNQEIMLHVCVGLHMSEYLHLLNSSLSSLSLRSICTNSRSNVAITSFSPEVGFNCTEYRTAHDHTVQEHTDIIIKMYLRTNTLLIVLGNAHSNIKNSCNTYNTTSAFRMFRLYCTTLCMQANVVSSVSSLCRYEHHKTALQSGSPSVVSDSQKRVGKFRATTVPLSQSAESVYTLLWSILRVFFYMLFMFYSHNNRPCPKASLSMSMITSPWVIL